MQEQADAADTWKKANGRQTEPSGWVSFMRIKKRYQLLFTNDKTY